MNITSGLYLDHHLDKRGFAESGRLCICPNCKHEFGMPRQLSIGKTVICPNDSCKGAVQITELHPLTWGELQPIRNGYI